MANSLVYQFKISHKRIKPQIWRRIQVPQDYSFLDFHLAIQHTMGWKDDHLYEFEVKNPETGIKTKISKYPEDCEQFNDFDERSVSGEEAKISRHFSTPKQTATYLYDFGACWELNIVLEKILPAKAEMKYPVCIAGKRANPPEYSGGSSDDDDDDFDPEKFDPKSVSFDRELGGLH